MNVLETLYSLPIFTVCFLNYLFFFFFMYPEKQYCSPAHPTVQWFTLDYTQFWLISSKFTPFSLIKKAIILYFPSQFTRAPSPPFRSHFHTFSSLFTPQQTPPSPASFSADDLTSYLTEKTKAVRRELLWTGAAISSHLSSKSAFFSIDYEENSMVLSILLPLGY